MPTNSGKDTIYIDIDDEITSVIEKVRGSNEKIVALVLPKRASVLQSIVNMKLLKRSADGAKKNLVLITSEAGLLPLAGTVGIHVAKNLQTKPEIPSVANTDDDDEIPDAALDDDEVESEVTAQTAGSKPVGELAAAGALAAAASAKDDSIETLQMDDEPAEAVGDAKDQPKNDKKTKKNNKLAIPNFNKFRLRLVLIFGLLLILIVGWILANVVLPKATITLTTDTSDINANLNLNIDTSAKSLNTSTSTVPAQSQQVQKNQSQQVATTGKKNTGTAATGNVTMTAQACAPNLNTPGSVPAGTGITSNGMTFITQQDATFGYTNSKGQCVNFGSGSIPVTAQSGGASYNLNSATFSVAGRSDVTANGSTGGGTDNIIQIVAQADIDSANSKLAAQDTGSIKQQLQQQLKQAGLYPIVATFAAATPNTTASSKVGDQASTVTVSQTASYTMFGVKQADLKTLVDNNVKSQIDTNKQSILNEGLDNAQYHVTSATDKTAQIGLTTTATAGPDLKADAIKAQVTGKKTGDITSMLKADPGVTAVDVHLSPFWVTKAPKASKITVVFQKAAK